MVAATKPIPQPDPEISARSRIRRWVAEQMDAALASEGSVRMPEIARAATSALLKDDTFVRGPLADFVQLMAYEEASRYVQRSRAGIVALGDEAITKEELAARVKPTPFLHWVEHSRGRNLRLLDMDRDDCKAAADDRFRRAQTDVARGRLLMGFARELKAGEVVRDRWTPEQIAERYGAILTKMRD